MQHPICGTETYDYFFGVESSLARVFITSEGGHILKPSLSPPIFSFTNCYHLNDHHDEIVYILSVLELALFWRLICPALCALQQCASPLYFWGHPHAWYMMHDAWYTMHITWWMLSRLCLEISTFLHTCTCMMPRTFLPSHEILFPV